MGPGEPRKFSAICESGISNRRTLSTETTLALGRHHRRDSVANASQDRTMQPTPFGFVGRRHDEVCRSVWVQLKRGTARPELRDSCGVLVTLQSSWSLEAA